MVKIKRTKLLLIFMDNTEEIINRESTWKQKMMKLSLRTYGTPISIGSGTLKCNFDELEKLLSDRLNIIKQPLRPNK
ncbi:MAG TPA: STM3941 family protein, partial [Bacteroidia bacterium]|nr:STM3941 family protein [Bacteroidia bacterium]